MHWIAPSEKDTASTTLEKRLWDAADQFRANSGLKAQEYSGPVLGLIFLRFAEARFAAQRAELEKAGASSRRGSRVDDPAAYHAEGILYLAARGPLRLPPATCPRPRTSAPSVNEAMRDIEKHNPQLAGVLPKTYKIFTSTLLKELLKKVSEIPATIDYDAFGRIYEYFLGEFARTEGQKGGEFYTPAASSACWSKCIEPFHGRILDPACGSGGMFVQSARFVAEHQKNPAAELAIFGVEKIDETGRLCRMNLAVHGLEGRHPPRRQDQQLLRRPAQASGQLRLRPRQSAVQRQRRGQGTARRTWSAPAGAFPSACRKHRQRELPLDPALLLGAERQGPRRASSWPTRPPTPAPPSRSSGRQLIEAKAVDAMVAVGPNMFYTVTLPCTLWFLDRGKAKTPRADSVLFVDARHIYRQIDRAHRDWTPAQIGFLANVVRLYRGEDPDFTLGGDEAKAKLKEVFGKKPKYADVPGLCKAATLKEIEAQGWSLNPGRYVGVAPGEEVSDEDFKEQLEALNEELEVLNAQAQELEKTIAANVAEILEA